MDAATTTLALCFVLGLAVFVFGWRRQRRALGPGRAIEDLSSSAADLSGGPGGEVLEESPYRSPDAPAADSPDGPPELPTGSATPYRGIDLAMIAFIVLIYFAQSVISAALPSEEMLDQVTVAGLLVAVGFQIMIAALVVGFMAWRLNPVTWLGLRWARWPWVLLIAPAVLVGMWVFIIALDVAGFNSWVQGWSGDGTQDTVMLFQESDDWGVLVVMSLLAVVVAPVTEEVIFRGYLYPAARHFSGRWPAALFSALVFAAAHSNVLALLPLLVLALVLVFVYGLTRSIWAPIACHAIFNGATVVVQFLVRAGVVEVPAS